MKNSTIAAHNLSHAIVVHTVAELPPGCFWPSPDVTSSMIAIRRTAEPLHDNPRRLAAFCQRLSEHRRKQVGSILGREGPWPMDIAPEHRAEQLSVAQLIALEAAHSQTPL